MLLEIASRVNIIDAVVRLLSTQSMQADLWTCPRVKRELRYYKESLMSFERS